MDIKCEGSDSDNEVKIEDEIHVGTKDALNMRNEPRMKVEPGVKREPEIKHETSTTQGRLIKKELLDQDLIIPESMPHRVHDERASSQLLVKGGVPIKPEPTTNNEMDVQYELDERHQSAIRTVMWEKTCCRSLLDAISERAEAILVRDGRTTLDFLDHGTIDAVLLLDGYLAQTKGNGARQQRGEPMPPRQPKNSRVLQELRGHMYGGGRLVCAAAFLTYLTRTKLDRFLSDVLDLPWRMGECEALEYELNDKQSDHPGIVRYAPERYRGRSWMLKNVDVFDRVYLPSEVSLSALPGRRGGRHDLYDQTPVASSIFGEGVFGIADEAGFSDEGRAVVLALCGIL